VNPLVFMCFKYFYICLLLYTRIPITGLSSLMELIELIEDEDEEKVVDSRLSERWVSWTFAEIESAFFIRVIVEFLSDSDWSLLEDVESV